MKISIICAYLLIFNILNLKVEVPKKINQQNFKQIFKVSPEQFIKKGSSNNKQYILLFIITQCQHCKQSNLLFTNTFIQYQKRFHLQDKSIDNQISENIQFGIINCQQSSSLCSVFNIQKYPTLYIVSQNGQICQYIGDQMPYRVMEYLQERQRQSGQELCKHIGHITLWTKLLGYLSPLLEFANYNTVLFVIAFMIGPFLFGFVYSKTKKQPQVGQAQIKKQ